MGLQVSWQINAHFLVAFQHTLSFSLPIIDIIRMVILLLEESPLYPLTQEDNLFS